MEVRKSTRVILDSDTLKSPEFATNHSITSLILNEDQNQIESELSFLEDESLKSLSPQPQPDLLIDLGDMSSGPLLDLETTIESQCQSQIIQVEEKVVVVTKSSSSIISTEVITESVVNEIESKMVEIQVSPPEISLMEPEVEVEAENESEISECNTEETVEIVDDDISVISQIENLAQVLDEDVGGDSGLDPEPEEEEEEVEDNLTHDTNVKEQKIKETTIMEKSSTSSTSSSTSSVSSSVVMNSSSTTTKSSVKATTVAKEQVTTGTAVSTAAAAVTATNATLKTATSSTTATVTATEGSSAKEQQSTIISSNNHETVVVESKNANAAAISNANHVNETANVKNTTGGTNKKKNKNNKNTSSESISVLHLQSQRINPNNPSACSTNQPQRVKVKDDVFSRVSVSFLRRSFDGDLNSLADSNNSSGDNNDFVDQVKKVDEIDGDVGNVSLLPEGESGADEQTPIILSRPSSIHHRPKSCLGIPNEVANKRWNSGEAKSQTGPHIVFIPGDDFSGVSVNKLKSSFTKFDNLAKKEMKGTAPVKKEGGEQPPQDSGEISAPLPVHICKSCNNEVFQMELIRAEKSDWHKNCFRCTTCRKALTLDSYSSNEGKIYCKPHFRDLFKPKTAVLTEEEEEKRRLEVIIRESEPVPLPPDVVRASEKSGPDIQDLKLDVKSKYELFENLGTKGESEKKVVQEEISEELKKTGSVQSRLAKYQSKVAAATAMEVAGVTDEDLAGGPRHRVKEEGEEEGESSGDEVMDPRLLRKSQPVDEINVVAVDEVRSKWELGINSKKEEISEARREEQSKFRCRLLLGKNTQMKDMYEKACEETALEKEQRLADLEAMKASENKAKELKELFEKGEQRTPQSESKLEKEVFDSEIAKNSRSLFKEMDKSLAAGPPTSISPVSRPNPLKRQESGSIRRNELPEGIEVVRSGERKDEIISPEDISSKFKFFETFEEKMSEKKSKERFRMTPPREVGDKEPTPPVEAYRDPNIIRSSDPSTEPDIPVTRTASKMLNVFRQLEQENSESGDAKKSFKPLKEFTPPRDIIKAANGHNDSGDSEDEGEEESEDEDVLDDAGEPKQGDEKDELLKQVGSLARATSLRLKFERWEREENAKNKDHNGYDPNFGTDEDQDGSNMASIESTKDLRAKFENYKDNIVEQEKMQKMQRGERLKVKRFVELTNNTGSSMDNCAACEKRVYAMEKLEAGGKLYHKTCFRCAHCKCVLRMNNFTYNHGVLMCTPHFKQLFKIKGNYDEGFGHQTARQAWEKKNREGGGTGAEEKEN